MIKKYIIKKKKKDNSEFKVQKNLPKHWLWLRCIFEELTLKEWEIIFLIDLGREFYTYNKKDNSYTKVIKRGYHIQSKSNKTKLDNIKNLPLF